MSELVSWMKELYTKANANNFEWKPVYPNNMICNGVEGLYTDMFFEKDGKYSYLKYTIDYNSRCDAEGMSHPEEGVKYYVLHEYYKTDLDEKFEIPAPTDGNDTDSDLDCLVNDYGRFRYVFEDEETAKCVVANELKRMIYPYTYILSDEETEEWNQFLKSWAT